MSMIFTLNKATGEVALFVESEDEHETDAEHSEEVEHSEGAEHSEETINPVIPNVYDIVWAAIFFSILWALMKFVLLPPIIKDRDERNAKAAAAREAASGTEANLAAIRAEHDAKLGTSRAEASGIIDAARAEVDADRQAQVAAVEAEIAQQRASASAEIETARAQALAGARGDVGSLAVGAASAVLGRDLDVGSHQSILDSYLDA